MLHTLPAKGGVKHVTGQRVLQCLNAPARIFIIAPFINHFPGLQSAVQWQSVSSHGVMSRPHVILWQAPAGALPVGGVPELRGLRVRLELREGYLASQPHRARN